MTITQDSERQYKLVAWVTVDYDDVTGAASADTNPTAAIELPNDAVVVGGGVVVDTNWDDDAAEAFTLDVGDADDTDRYTGSALSIDADAGSYQAITPTGYKYTAATDITVSVVMSVGSSTITQGSLRLFVEYVVQGRGNENQG